ncbi:hypothetical protein JDV02_007929 [Purpureocillium takamizusanense]|uniref:Uncharacterized protein n=1 Tax=Purpureocillium takamizusanense TaxID=2060973 RepID=A0A9Q8QJ68_9HYPO|nr:uncharacterized protein JDV02_007929 [Purpureocillium takamizusanense]UNI21999.1 hypothetical protein JDV02_007929 [Purpureocillium takamizusanense]
MTEQIGVSWYQQFSKYGRGMEHGRARTQFFTHLEGHRPLAMAMSSVGIVVHDGVSGSEVCSLCNVSHAPLAGSSASTTAAWLLLQSLSVGGEMLAMDPRNWRGVKGCSTCMGQVLWGKLGLLLLWVGTRNLQLLFSVKT